MYSVYRIVYVSTGTRIGVHMLPSNFLKKSFSKGFQTLAHIVYEDFAYYHCVIVFLDDKCPPRTKY